MSSMSQPIPFTTGVVTFLDVLGWKGIYERRSDAISVLTELVGGTKMMARTITRGRTVREIEVRSISDTIVLFTKCNENEASDAITAHGLLCKWIIYNSIIYQIPVRGAICFGEFDNQGNIFVGRAVDEAASWHEHADWVGVHLTPSAKYIYKPPASPKMWKTCTPPSKKSKVEWETHCLDWTFDWKNPEDEISNIKDAFRLLGPIVPEITSKFENTLIFIAATASPLKIKRKGIRPSRIYPMSRKTQLIYRGRI